jgi:hypothetical protein
MKIFIFLLSIILKDFNLDLVRKKLREVKKKKKKKKKIFFFHFFFYSSSVSILINYYSRIRNRHILRHLLHKSISI